MSADRRAIITLVGTVAIPVFVGLVVGSRWPEAGEGFYSTTAQVIATLFVALAVEFFARELSKTTGPLDGIRLVLLVGESWAGFFACLRALAGSPTAATAGLAGAGVTAASVLVSLSLYEEITATNQRSDRVAIIAAALFLLFLFIPVIVLILA